jgi:hypothetical protein
MTDMNEALRASEALDDRRGDLDPKWAAQARVDAALSLSPSMEPSPAGLHARIMARVSDSPAHAPRSTLRTAANMRWWGLGLAACLTAAAGVAWFINSRPTQQPVPITPPIASATSGKSNLNFAVLLSPLDQTGQAVQASVEAPLLREAQLMREDGKAGVDLVLSRLPVMWASKQTPP